MKTLEELNRLNAQTQDAIRVHRVHRERGEHDDSQWEKVAELTIETIVYYNELSRETGRKIIPLDDFSAYEFAD